MKIPVVVLLLVLLAVPVVAQDAQPAQPVTIHVVQRGETLYRIALHYGMTVEALSRLNGITNPGSIQVGQRLLVPGETVRTAVALTHIVQPGETLRVIAERYNVTIDELIADNDIPNANTIYVGQVLVIGSSAEAAVDVAAAPAVENTTTSSASSPVVHVVQRGETLYRIAMNYGVTVNDLVQANNIADATQIYAGQQLMISGVEVETPTVQLAEPLTSLDVTPQAPLEGQTFRVRFTTRVGVNVSATFLDRPIWVNSEQSNTVHTILQGVPVFTTPGIYPLQLILAEQGSGRQTVVDLNLQILSGRYGRESITLMADRAALLNPAVEENELRILGSVTGFASPERLYDGPLGLPAAATIISPFGTTRSYNGGPFDRFHSGTDFAGATGTPILAAAAGRVVLRDALNVRGNVTVLDHGWGVYTVYCHQSQQYVEIGDVVQTGQVIGTIGSTGRVSGAHLHWELWVGGVQVNPMQWVSQSFN